jgi:hypothetical protein
VPVVHLAVTDPPLLPSSLIPQTNGFLPCKTFADKRSGACIRWTGIARRSSCLVHFLKRALLPAFSSRLDYRIRAMNLPAPVLSYVTYERELRAMKRRLSMPNSTGMDRL